MSVCMAQDTDGPHTNRFMPCTQWCKILWHTHV